MTMKTFTTFNLLLLLVTSMANAQTLAPLVQTRMHYQTGILMTRGDDTGWDDMGAGFSFRSFQYLDPTAPGGFYLGFLSGAFSRGAGGVSLADTQLITLGWRGSPWGNEASDFAMIVDASVAPTIGARTQGHRIFGSAYTGIGLTFGLAFPILEGHDLGLSWEPVFPITSWGAPDAPNQGYSDFVLSWTVRVRTESRALSWLDRD